MVKLDVQTVEEMPEAEEGQTYEITGSEEFVSQVRGYKGLRVSMKDKDGNEVVESLWMRSPVGSRSKLGSFITVLGKDTKLWEGKRITFIAWKASNRVIQLAAPSEEKRKKS